MSILIKGAKMPKKGIMTIIINAGSNKADVISYDGSYVTMTNNEATVVLPNSEWVVTSDDKPIMIAPIIEGRTIV